MSKWYATLQFVGDGPQRETVERFVQQRNLSAAVSFRGHVPYEEMPSVYRESDLFVLPSRTEGVPRTVLEALASGIPVVTSDLPQLATFIPEVGATAPSGDIEAFARAIVELLRDGALRTRLGARAREVVTADWEWTATVERTTEQLESIRTPKK